METTIIIEFGIDCDPFCRHQEHFQSAAEEILGRNIQPISTCFGAWEWKESVTPEQHKKIAETLLHYYNNNKCRGAICTDLRKFM